MKLNWDKIVLTSAIIGMLGSVFGIFGGIFFQNIIILLIGLGIWALALILILGKAMHNFMT